jgi:hypothetical protein
MILGTGIFSLLLLLLPAAPEPAAAPPDGPPAEYPIFELDEWGGSGVGNKYDECTGPKEDGMLPGKQYYAWYKTNGYWRASPYYSTREGACEWMNQNCVCGCR